MNKMAHFTVEPKRFEIFKEMMLRHLRNFRAEQPHTHAIYYCNVILESKVWTRQQLADALKGKQQYVRMYISFHFVFSQWFLSDVTCEMLQEFISKFFTNVHIEALLHGNLTKKVCVWLLFICSCGHLFVCLFVCLF